MEIWEQPEGRKKQQKSVKWNEAWEGNTET